MNAHAQFRIDVKRLMTLAGQLFLSAGADAPVAESVARVLVEGELLGHRTHGVNLVGRYLDQLQQGQALGRSSDFEVLREGGVAGLFDGHYVLGPYCVERALAFARAAARQHGVGVGTVRRSAHIGCLAAYLKPLTDQGLLALVLSSDPSAALVSAAGGCTPVLTPNPIAAGIPGREAPILLDVSMSSVTLGLVNQYLLAGKKLPHPVLVSGTGQVSDDPGVMQEDPRGAILPLGGVAFGHKGFALGLLVEALTGALAGHGRKDRPEQWGAGVTVLVLDPDHFAGIEAFIEEMAVIADAVLASRPLDPKRPVRLPGQAGLGLRRAALEEGVALAPEVHADLARRARDAGLEAL
ncbi:Malate dehydrogenase [Paraburkholderia unamae]|uniref:Ldh family oxidoreductase n=1 Tax=Paraburkholderia unamae TaxID=219649 RepID=UPI001CAAE583|nr:Ldh family oxidoreductase [Paraburkholderia unamae]CAG9259950.1 Malate dehydrogenase [Paraburkholderia unamae]